MEIRSKATTRTRAKTEITTITTEAIIIKEGTIIITQGGRRKNEEGESIWMYNKMLIKLF